MADTAADIRNAGMAVVYFLLSALFTWWLIDQGASLYHFDNGKMMLSCSIAGAKWAIQIIAALMLLKDRRWLFIRNIAFTCFVGSCILLPFCFPAIRSLLPGNSFLLSLIAAVAVMLMSYYRSVVNSRVPLKWYYSWLACLAVAVSLQLTVVFHVI